MALFSYSTWRKLQAASGLAFGIFLCLHFGVSHYSAISSYEHGRAGLERARSLYQPVELVFLGALALHLISNAVVYMQRTTLENEKEKTTKTTATPGSLELKAHRLAGYILSLSIGGHIFATRGVSWLFLEDPQQYDYTILTIVSDQVPFYLFVVYLIVFGMAGNWHLVYGVRSALATLQGRSVQHTPFPIPLKTVALILHILLITSVLAICTDFVYPIDRKAKADVYATIHKKVLGW